MGGDDGDGCLFVICYLFACTNQKKRGRVKKDEIGPPFVSICLLFDCVPGGL